MGNIVTATKLLQDGELVTQACEVNINCEMLVGNSPRNVWLIPQGGCCGDTQYGVSTSLPASIPAGALQGVQVELAGGRVVIVDALNSDELRDACNACCGTVPEVAARYAGVFPVPGAGVTAVYQFTRTDSGGSYAYDRASLDYFESYVPGTFRRVSYVGGVSTYEFTAYADPVFRAGDTKTSETNRVFSSNTAPVLDSGEQYLLTLTADGQQPTPIAAASLALLVTAATGNTAYSTKGTWAVSGSKITLTSSTVNYADIYLSTTPV